jgi:hypothetical protein
MARILSVVAACWRQRWSASRDDRRLPSKRNGSHPKMAKNDRLLQKGDIVVTDRGLLLYRGLAPDGAPQISWPFPIRLIARPIYSGQQIYRKLQCPTLDRVEIYSLQGVKGQIALGSFAPSEFGAVAESTHAD